MKTPEMTTEQINTRLAALADELIQAQGALATLLDGGTAGVSQYVKAQGTVELLKAEQARLCKALPFAIQAELDKAEAETDDLATAARAALTDLRREAVNQLRGAGYTSAKEDVLLNAVDHRDDVTERRNEAMKASNAAHRAAMEAARHRYR